MYKQTKQGIICNVGGNLDMMEKHIAFTFVFILLFALPSYSTQAEEPEVVEAFGDGFLEVVIADAFDDLRSPTDLEFHPGRANELWISNQATDSMTIVSNTGLENQTSQNREDAYSNHFLEEVSAIAFGAYHPEFDWQWGSAQETDNTYCGQGTPNNFMGPSLWPSSLDHYAVENQNNNLLGSHIDMNHESPFGVGIAHDVDNVYWYNDGHYGELVRYDFQEDHDTGYDDHSDAIVQRYSDVQLTHILGLPGHMVLDKDSGILYIADPAANRVLWVNTDDSTYTTTDIMNDASRLEPLAEYSRINGIEWGVLATGLNRPSGIALGDGELFVSEYGNGNIVAYELSTNGKVGTYLDEIQTTASAIMGLEIGPNGHLYYVDHDQNEVVRIDPFMDEDGDGVGDDADNCPMVPNASQSNFDGDDDGDACDQDDDNDGVLDADDLCQKGALDWLSISQNDHDGDGCKDAIEDADDDNDGVYDFADMCSTGTLAWTSNGQTDYDGDGCSDADEDVDDDNDGICDATQLDDLGACIVSTVEVDLCPTSSLTFTSSNSNDADRDGCEDTNEDTDDDNDGFLDSEDACPMLAGTSSQGDVLGCTDGDGDGYSDTTDAFPVDGTQWADLDEDGYGDNPDGFQGDACIIRAGTSTEDRFGCADTDADGWSDLNDAFPAMSSQHRDSDDDGYGDAADGFQPDQCPTEAGTSTQDRFGCLDTDGDGWSDLNDALPEESTQHLDSDGDGYGDNAEGAQPDACPSEYGTSSEQIFGCLDGDADGWADTSDAYPSNSLLWSDVDQDGYADQQGTNLSDDCPEVYGRSTEDALGCPDTDGDGWSNSADSYPEDATKHEAGGLLSMQNLYIGLLVLFITLSFLGVMARRRSTETAEPAPLPFVPTQVQPSGPPLPPGGLPPGWTMEQWAWYGEDYLKGQ